MPFLHDDRGIAYGGVVFAWCFLLRRIWPIAAEAIRHVPEGEGSPPESGRVIGHPVDIAYKWQPVANITV